jgi:hypothetical protein
MTFQVTVGVIFSKKKDELKDKLVELINDLKNENFHEIFLRFDDT